MVDNKPGYRADIEGLRALAVILVILYHFEVPGITGGFIGVDVFFVISGFVITQLLQRAFAKGTFSFKDFYARRIRRLVPLFLLVSTVTFLMISPFYIGEAYYIFAKSWLSSLIGISNLYYFSELTQYFAPETRSLSLLHTWSLAVEEQLYLIWPLTLYLAYRFGKGGAGRWPFKITLVATFALSVYMANQWPAAAYYLLPARLFEFMLGTGVALFATQLPRLNRPVAELLSVAGLAMVIATALLISKHDVFPGWNALWPTLGTAMVIYAGLHQPATFSARLLSLPVMVFFGGISYSMYLWHWPPVALMHYQLLELTALNRIALMVAVVLVSWLSYRFVENRFRHRPWSLKKSFWILVFTPLLIIWAIQSTIRIADDLSFRIPEERRELYKIIANNNPADLYKRCFKGDPVAFNQSKACLFGEASADGQPNSMLIGDSHGIAQIGFVEQLIEGKGYSMLMVTRASTPFLPTALAEQIQAVDPTQVARNRALSEYLSQRPMTVFLGAWWNSYLRSPVFEDAFVDTISWLEDKGHKVIVLEDVPELPSSSYAECLLKSMKDCTVSAVEVENELENFYRFKRTVSQQHPDVIWVNPRKVLCDEARCQTILNGIPLYRDESHLNNVGAIEIGKEYLKRFENPLPDLR
ncbi:acyltransferase [Alcanivorax sp. S6407]|uniref:acyltransferase family protein n=1 Tax=Alcanivorax sp. S6407 TaxID=2926424 RepID=UPI001FF1534D|nr:acyltransferase family protein [Alcanivorax sp. S6407]MCK0155117.1 acyltransferase [Alcanivorax sp. S6407]